MKWERKGGMARISSYSLQEAGFRCLLIGVLFLVGIPLLDDLLPELLFSNLIVNVSMVLGIAAALVGGGILWYAR